MRLIILVVITLLLFAGCDSVVEIKNSVPRLTWLQVEAVGGQTAEITLWVYDLEGDPVDLSGGWALDGELEITPISWGEGGHGTNGLTTHEARFSPDGQPHLVIWNVGGLPSELPIQLVFTPEDGTASQGETVMSPSFKLTEGLPEPVRWTMR
jgi:hypothetical protein